MSMIGFVAPVGVLAWWRLADLCLLPYLGYTY